MRLDHQSPPRRKTLESNGWVYYLLHKFSTAVYWITTNCTQFEIINPLVFSGSGNWHISMGSSAHSLRVWSEMSARTVATSETRDPHLLLRGLSSSLDWDPQFSAGQLPGPQMLEATLSPPTICSLSLVANRMLFSSDPSYQAVKEWLFLRGASNTT